jgi:hypothetical protein
MWLSNFLLLALGIVVLGWGTGVRSIGGVHPGTVGAAINYATVWVLRVRRLRAAKLPDPLPPKSSRT